MIARFKNGCGIKIKENQGSQYVGWVNPAFALFCGIC